MDYSFCQSTEITLFHFGEMIRSTESNDTLVQELGQNSFHFNDLMPSINHNGSNTVKQGILARVAGLSLEMVDSIIGKTGNPIGIKSHRPFHSTGEDFLQNYLGMIGLPMDERSDFPEEDSLILLTENAKFDIHIIKKIKKHLSQGKNVIISSGLLHALQDKGLNDIVELRYSDRKAFVQSFTTQEFQSIHIKKSNHNTTNRLSHK